MDSTSSKLKYGWRLAAVLLMLVLVLLPVLPVYGQDEDATQEPEPYQAVQAHTGKAELGDNLIYVLPDLKAGQMLYIRADRTLGNLDPFLALADRPLENAQLNQAFWTLVREIAASGGDPVLELPGIYDQAFVAWDDDGGEGYNAAFEYAVPDDGDYYLLVSSSPSREASKRNFGDYRLLIGINEPAVLDGEPETTGDVIAVFDKEASQLKVKVQDFEGELTEETPEETLDLTNLREEDLLYAHVEVLSGDLRPALALEDFGGKLLRTDNLLGQANEASLTYRLDEAVDGFQLRVVSVAPEGKLTSGIYRLQVGVNAPAVLSGDASPSGDMLIKEPVQARLGVELQQITDVDQVAENFGAVAQLTMQWDDPALAFSPDECNCDLQVFTLPQFEKYVQNHDTYWPEFTILNQQGNRWTQNRNIVVQSDGQAIYQERFTTDFQAPDFDFTRFPFDSQQLYIRVQAIFPERFYIYDAPEEMSGIGNQLGEEEWEVIDSSLETSIEDGNSHYALGFEVQRQLTFYIFRIFVPIILVIIVSWFTFFLKDYDKRVDVAGANLLVFVAFNFTISGELPRLGYLTFMDVVLIGTFIISALVVVFNVFLSRLEIRGKEELAAKIDAFSIWVYPLAYAVGGILAYFLYLR